MPIHSYEKGLEVVACRSGSLAQIKADKYQKVVFRSRWILICVSELTELYWKEWNGNFKLHLVR